MLLLPARRAVPHSRPGALRGFCFWKRRQCFVLLTPRIKLLLRHAMFSPPLLVGWWVARPAHMFWPCVSITQNRWPNGRRPTKHTNSHQIHMGYWRVSTYLPPLLLLPSLTVLERKKQHWGTYHLALSLCSLLAVWEIHSSPLSLDNPTFSFITVMWFHVSDDSAGGKALTDPAFAPYFYCSIVL